MHDGRPRRGRPLDRRAAIMAIVETSKPGPERGIKPMAVFAILYVLCAALIPLLRRADLEQR